MPAREIKVEILGDSSNFARAAQQAADTSQPLEGTWKNLQQEAANLGASMDKLSEKLDPNSGKFEAVADAAGSLEQVFIGTTDILGVLGEQFGVPLGPMEEWTHAAADVAGGIESTITGFTGLAEQFGPMVAKMGPAIASTWAYVTALLAQAAAFIAANAPMLIIIGTIALVAGGVLLLIKHWDEIVEKVPFLKAAIDPIVSFFTGTLIPAFVSVWEKGLKPVIDFVTDHWKEIGTLILLPFAPLILIATDGFGIRSKLIEGFSAVITWMTDTWKTVKGFITSPFDDLLETAKGAFGIKDAIIEAFKAIPGAIESALSGLMTLVQNLVNPVIDAYNNTVGKIPGVPDIPRIGGGGGGGDSSAYGAPVAGGDDDTMTGRNMLNMEAGGAGGGGGGGVIPTGAYGKPLIWNDQYRAWEQTPGAAASVDDFYRTGPRANERGITLNFHGFVGDVGELATVLRREMDRAY